MEIPYDQLTGRFLTHKEMIAGTGVTYRQLDYARRTGIIHATHGMFSSFDRKKPVKVWELKGKDDLFSGAKALWEVDHYRTRHAQRLIRLLDAGVEFTTAIVLAKTISLSIISGEDLPMLDALREALDEIYFGKQVRP